MIAGQHSGEGGDCGVGAQMEPLVLGRVFNLLPERKGGRGKGGCAGSGVL